MATIPTLVNDNVLDEIQVVLEDGEFPARQFYGSRWQQDDLPNLEAGRLKATETPAEQLDNVLYKWIAGKEIKYDRMFKDLMPMKDEVWELKTADLRIFGWMYQPGKFIAVFADYADLYKGTRAKKSYEDARERVLKARAELKLDEPKFTGGTFDDLVRV